MEPSVSKIEFHPGKKALEMGLTGDEGSLLRFSPRPKRGGGPNCRANHSFVPWLPTSPVQSHAGGREPIGLAFCLALATWSWHCTRGQRWAAVNATMRQSRRRVVWRTARLPSCDGSHAWQPSVLAKPRN